MHDDFSALDLLSMGGFRLSSAPATAGAGKRKRLGGKRHIGRGGMEKRAVMWVAKTGVKRGLTAFLPMLGVKKQPFGKLGSFQGWPVALSWPTKEFTTPDLWVEGTDRPAS